ncbi:MAG TPA: FG-GAP-like repeat-containing protein [Gemmatimonadales bacterium]|nr:FG-GAP-like repeat-containing protein [Gemmatimonadales bacterium]
MTTSAVRPWLGAALLIAACAPAPDTTWHVEHGYRWRSLHVPRRGSAGFTSLDSSRTGIRFANIVSESLMIQNRILAQGAGVCLGDVDRDGLPDVFLARTAGPSAMYRNRGRWRFEDVTSAAGVTAADRHATGCTLVDTDGDGDLDLILVALGGPNALFLNDGTGRFTEQGAEAGLESTAGSTTPAVADVDGDGWLDLYVTNYKAYTTLDRIPPQQRAFDQVVRQLGPGRYEVREQYRRDYRLVHREDLGGVSLEQRADPDVFYRNDGTGRFIRESIARNRRFLDEQGRPLEDEPEYFGLAAMFADLNGDGAPDLYVANDFEDPDQFWINDGRGTFRLAPWHSVRSVSNSGMAVDVGDVNRDGWPDLFEVDMLSRDTRRLKTQIPTHTAAPKRPGLGDVRPQMQRNTLQLSRGDGTFAEIARLAGVGASGWSWSTLFLDVDLDGWEDILVGTGHVWDLMDGDTQYRLRNRLQEIDWRRMQFEFPPLPEPNVAFRNRGDLTFEDVSRGWRFDVGPDISHGMATGDLDGDGDLDVVINRLGAPAAVLRNDAAAPRIAVRLAGEAPNTAGIGSVVRVRGGAVPLQQREVIAGGLYLSGSDAQLTFATGSASQVTVEVDWRDGRRSIIEGALPNRLYEVDQASAQPVTAAQASAGESPLFVDVSEQLGGHRHVEPYFDDYARQLLLPNAFSQLGPGVAWDDVDRDGREDLLVGAGRSGTLAWFRNDRSRMRPMPARIPPAPGDLTTVLGWSNDTGRRLVIAGVSNYEMGSIGQALAAPSVVAYSPSTGSATVLLAGDSASVGPLALADYDADGDLDLFVGARVLPGAYPLSPSSRLFRNDGGKLVPDARNNALFAGMGMVSAATFTDINGDARPDLITAIEWGTIRVFVNEGGRFRSVQMPGLAGLYSRWNGLATGDLDGDGRLDIVATSWGRNIEYHPTDDRPLLLYFGPFGQRGRPSVLLAQHDERIGGAAPLASFERLRLALPGVAQRIRTFAAYADAAVDSVLGPLARNAIRLGATTMDHTVFLNRGDRFEARPLHTEAQYAPAFYAGIADFDGDGKEDVFLTQNFFATEVGTPRYDAGRSVLLTGDGTGGLEPVAGQRSGLLVYGEQRGAAYADFDGDGRLDLAVSQNAAPTRLFRNVGARPGLRVRLVGPPGNPAGVGAQIRLRYGERTGPVREVQAGSGYWSQNGAVQVLGMDGEPTALWVRWPGGREQVVPLTPGIAEVTVQPR